MTRSPRTTDDAALVASCRNVVIVYQLVSPNDRIAHMTKAAIYARISVDDKKTPAVENQIANLKKLAVAHGYEVVRTFSDDGISAFSGKTRPGFLDLVNGIRARDFDVILAVAEDRLTRSSEEKIGLQSDCVKAGITWHTSASGAVDPSTAQGGLLATITGAVAQYESQVKQERLQRSVSDRLAAGKDLGGPRPFGFEKNRTTVREHEADALKTAYKMILDGGTVYGVAKFFTEMGIKRDRAAESPWRPQTVRHILLRERNCGRLVVKGVQYADDLTALIDAKTFDRAKAILENPARAPRRGPKPTTYAAVGSVRCGVCGSYLSQSGARLQGVRNFRCSPDSRPMASAGQRHPTIAAPKLDAMLRALVFLRLYRLVITERGLDTTPTPMAALQAQVVEYVRQRDLAQELLFAPGANIAAAKRKLSQLSDQIEKTQRELDAAMNADVTSSALNAARAGVESSMVSSALAETEFNSHWDAITVEDRRALVTALLPAPKLWPTDRVMRVTAS
jgi:site-specific DNA recombinase